MIVMRCSHCPSIESPISRAASQVTFIGRLQNGPCIDAIGDACSLDKEMRKSLLFLNIDECVCFIGGGPVKKPFLVHTPPLDRPVLSETEIEHHNKRLWRQFNMPAIIPETQLATRVAQSIPPDQSNDTAYVQIALLNDLHRDMFKGVAKRADAFIHKGTRFTRQEIDNLLRDMARHDLCSLITLRCSRRGSATHFYVPSSKGYELIGNPPDMLAAVAGSGIEEAFLLRFICKHFNDTYGICAIPHGRYGGKTVDISFEYKGKTYAIEISVTTTIQHEAHQARKNHEAGFDKSITLFLDKKKYVEAKDIFLSEIVSDGNPYVVVVELWHLLKCPIQEICECIEIIFSPSRLEKCEEEEES